MVEPSRASCLYLGCVVAIGSSLFCPAGVTADTPNDPVVRALVQPAFAELKGLEDVRLGGQCLTALAFLKHGAPDTHRHIRRAVAACRSAARLGPPIPIDV